MTTPTPPVISAPRLHGFNNFVTGGLLMVITILLTTGFALIWYEFLLSGATLMIAGIWLWWRGNISLSPAKPIEAGILTSWGRPIVINGRPIIVGGRTIIADYWPFYIGVIIIDITNQDIDFDVTVTDSNGVKVKGKVSVTYLPDLEDALDYIQAGQKDGVKAQQDDIVVKHSRMNARTMKVEEIVNEGEKISDPLMTELEAGNYGIKIFGVQAVFEMPDGISNAAEEFEVELKQRKAENQEYLTILQAAQTLQKAFQDDLSRIGPVPSLQDCISEIKTQRLIKDEKVVMVTSTGGNMNITNLDLGAVFGKKKEKK